MARRHIPRCDRKPTSPVDPGALRAASDGKRVDTEARRVTEVEAGERQARIARDSRSADARPGTPA